MQVVKSGMLQEQEKAIRTGKEMGVMGFFEIGKALYIINKNDLWRFSEAKNFVEYVESCQGLKRTWSYALMGVYERFAPILADHEELRQVDVSRLVRLLPYVKDETATELALMAATTPARAFDANLRNMSGKVAPDECDHPDGFVVIRKCKICGLRVKE
jgi:hypothetical protein